jgi:arylsulfatase A-like enzyme
MRPSVERLAAIAAALLCANGCGWPGESAPHEGSVVLVVIDTLRADRMGLYGHGRPTTPELERIAERSVVFDRAYAASSWTLPSIASIFTGLRPRNHGAGRWAGSDNEPKPGFSGVAIAVDGETKRFSSLDPAVPTLAEALRGAGYATAAIVDNPFLQRAFKMKRGFDHYDQASGGDDGGRRAREVVDRGLEWIELGAGDRFFLLLHFYDPHMNYDAPAPMGGRFSDEYAAGGDRKRPVRNPGYLRRRAPTLDEGTQDFIRAAYDEEVAYVDRELGRLLDRLDEISGAHPPLVVITADHGEELFDHASFGHGHTLFEEQLRVPLILISPAVEPGRVDAPVSIIDIAPTILAAVGVPAPARMDGRSLWATATRRTPLPPRPVIAERTGDGPDRRAVVDWPYKLIATAGAARPELYDLEADPNERRNLAADASQLVSRLKRHLADTRDSASQGAPVELNAETERALSQLGYLDARQPDTAADRDDSGMGPPR